MSKKLKLLIVTVFVLTVSSFPAKAYDPCVQYCVEHVVQPCIDNVINTCSGNCAGIIPYASCMNDCTESLMIYYGCEVAGMNCMDEYCY